MTIVIDSMAWIPKDRLTSSALEALRARMTLHPKGWGDHEREPVKVYSESPTYFGVPREWYFANRKPHHVHELRTTWGARSTWSDRIRFEGALRPAQHQAVQRILQTFREGALGGIYEAKPGTGKTVTGIAIIAETKLPTLVVVHKEFLLDQWRERLAQFLPAAQIGHVQGDICDFQGKQVVLGMVHSLAERTYPQALYNHFGLYLVDETHRLGAPTFSQNVPRFPARLRLGLTATPRRKDGLDKVFWWHIGPILHKSSETLLKAKVKRVWTDFELASARALPLTALTSLLCESDARNRAIAREIVAAAQAGRKCLVLSERLEHLRQLETLVSRVWPTDSLPPTMDQYIGGRDAPALARAAKAQVIFATVQFVSEGLDIPTLDTLFLTTHVKDIEQIVGRVTRPHPEKKPPIVVDFRDDEVPIFRSLARARDRQYLTIAA